ncbi:nucleotide sugar dehydrogenase [Saccharopolyspora phatthalungensis]|uniref:Nucleotide sugar dehydrogenase n=1 Tax=Saccharopolyspora phatthalungensis TaxID=664693 RepID=A0A840QBP1_9PSEU|nr:nucleotide sugar dehydrogenase [Saccharopolyspora phatthalungensis]MBB5157826.1 nucleotide sugar dehydrogenase [Saccharopolyspora phatthalungensis]
MTEHPLALAVNGRERLLADRLIAFEPREPERTDSVVVVGLGYVGLPTACALRSPTAQVTGFDISEDRLRAIKTGEVDLPELERKALSASLAAGDLQLSCDPSVLGGADAVIVCVPTPVDTAHEPDLAALRAACETVVSFARRGQVIILTSTTFVGTTRQLLVEPLAERGLRVGTDVHVAFSPERIDPGNFDHVQRETPRVVGGATQRCAERAAEVVRRMTDSVYLVSSPEVAELTKLYENIFRAVNLALANEIADACAVLDLDPIEVTIAAGTKPYGFLGSFPGPGVGGHCIPCDPYYLLWQLGRQGLSVPVIEQAMQSIDQRPGRVVQRVVEMLGEAVLDHSGARVLIAGVSYKAGVRDLRESPALPILAGLRRLGIDVHYYDPLLPEITLADGTALTGEQSPRGRDWDVTVLHTLHPGIDYSWARDCPRVLDATYQFDAVPHRRVL